MKLLLLSLILFTSNTFSSGIKYSEKEIIYTQEYKLMIINKRKAYINKTCTECMAKELFIKNECYKESKQIRAIKQNGDFEIICYFKDKSWYIQ